MPVVAQFRGIFIRMYWESGGRHHRPHFHAYYQADSAVYAIDNLELLDGHLSPRQYRAVAKWARIHRKELQDNWVRMSLGKPAHQIEPLG